MLTAWYPVILTSWRVSFWPVRLWGERLDCGPSILSSASPSASDTVETQVPVVKVIHLRVRLHGHLSAYTLMTLTSSLVHRFGKDGRSLLMQTTSLMSSYEGSVGTSSWYGNWYSSRIPATHSLEPSVFWKRIEVVKKRHIYCIYLQTHSAEQSPTEWAQSCTCQPWCMTGSDSCSESHPEPLEACTALCRPEYWGGCRPRLCHCRARWGKRTIS